MADVMNQAYWTGAGKTSGAISLPRFIGEFKRSVGEKNRNHLLVDFATGHNTDYLGRDVFRGHCDNIFFELEHRLIGRVYYLFLLTRCLQDTMLGCRGLSTQTIRPDHPRRFIYILLFPLQSSRSDCGRSSIPEGTRTRQRLNLFEKISMVCCSPQS